MNAVATIQAPAGSFALVGLLAVIGPTRYLMGVAWVPAGTTGPLVGAITVFAPSSVIGTAGILIQYYSFQAGATIAMRCASYPQFEGLHYTVLEHHS